jgi:hypothetical protein
MSAALQGASLETRVRRLIDLRRDATTTRRLGPLAVVAPALAALTVATADVALVVADGREALLSLRPDASASATRPAASVMAAPDSRGDGAASTDASLVPAATDLVRPASTRRRAAASALASRRLVSPAAFDTGGTSRVLDGGPPARAIAAVDLAATDLAPPIAASVPLTSGALAPAPTGAPVPVAAPDLAAPWTAAADGGVVIARGSRRAAVATAGFFSKLGRQVVSAF